MNIKETVARVFGRDDGDAEETGKSEAPDALELIHSDHQEVSALFEQALNDGTPSAQRRKATAQILQALTVHAEMEEQLFYPALRKAGGREDRDMVLEAYEEHGVVKDLVAKIEAIQGRDETLKAKLTVLKELVQHHVKEEESEVFGEARKRLGDERLQALGEEMQRFKKRRLKGPEPARNGKRGDRKAKKSSTARKTATRKTNARKGAKRAR
jgi:hemerythrin-like domain-containing protein